MSTMKQEQSPILAVGEGKMLVDGLSDAELSYINYYMTSSMKVLVLNCGNGSVSAYLSTLCCEVVSACNDTKSLQIAQQAYPRLTFHEMAYFHLSYEDDYFDAVVFAGNGIDYVYPETKRILALGEVWKVLKRTGLFIFSSHNRDARISTASSFLNIFLNLLTFQFLNDYWLEITKKGIQLVWYGQIENELLTLRDLGFNIADMNDLERSKAINCYVARKR